MTPQEIKEAGQRLFKAKQYADAVPLLKAASEAFPEDESIWSELVLAARHAGQAEQAIAFARLAIKHHPLSDWLWRQLANEQIQINQLDQAEKSLNNARRFDPNSEWLWRYYAELYRKQKYLEKEIYALEKLCALEEASGNDFNQLGIAYHNHKDFAKAVEYYRRSYEINPSVCPLYNMGLVFNDPEVSRDLDAADAYHRALAVQPGYANAQNMLEKTKAKLNPLAERAKAAAAWLVKFNDRFRFYANPFELLQIKTDCSLDELGVKELQRAKKLLLQEIDINEGKVGWLEDYPLDKARALAIVDELDDETKKRYHWEIFQNRPLLAFLTRGDIQHFLYSDTFFPLDMLEFLDEEPDFLEFLSKPFAQQYNHVLTQAIDRRLFPVVEILFDGRRWVNLEDEDLCLQGAFNRIGSLVELMKSEAAKYSKDKPVLKELDGFLHAHSFVELFNLLPTAFASFQRDIVAEIRSLAIACYNEHEDAELSLGILNICKRFTSRSVELTKRLETDFQTIEEIISEQRRIRKEIIEQLFRKSNSQNDTGNQSTPNWVFANNPNGTPERKSHAKIIFKWVAAVAVIGCVIYGINSSESSHETRYTNSNTQPFTYKPPTSPISSPNPQGTYRVPSYISTQLNDEKRKIESEKLSVLLLEAQISNLEREIENKKLYLNQGSQIEIDEYNKKVDEYNNLLEKARAQTVLVNQLVDRYNQKLRQYGR